MPRAVIFDLDDTLVDQRTAAHEAVVSWAAELGVVGPEVARRWDAVAERHYRRYQRREITFQEQRRERVREFLGRELSDDGADIVFAGYLSRYEAGWRVFPDVPPVLDRLAGHGIRLAILTNGESQQQLRKLDRVGLTERFEAVVCSSELPAGKPDPPAFLTTVHRLGVAPEETLMVGDSLAADVEGALAAGLDAVLVDRRDQHADAGVRRVTSLDELFVEGR
ncbi:haloacid dehalogenase [Serinicoccus sp. CNJ-927]|uniref:HAD family hydrolase n=1 Tax=Serinicoccus sp. CNJ-927 TaxID=1904970 RepID=UPI0009615E4D|nr:HAD family hydrolase [Serinicoccus sp. CNJ-927]OLT44750.1 haloacid dehalogenase [Serinicoccus sp. CNJ-927]